MEASLASASKSFDSFPRILDFGCGCGRVLTWLAELGQRCELHGTDIDAMAIRWASDNLSHATFHHNQPTPPLDFADDSFDLVYCHSVFTHIDADYQDMWLDELHRVTRPGGTLVLSVHGEHAFNSVLASARGAGEDTSRWESTLQRDGILYIHDDAWTGGPFPDFYHSTMHAPWYVFAHWGERFTIRSYLPRRGLGFQDYIVLERPSPDTPVEATYPQLSAPAAALEIVAPRAEDADVAVDSALARLEDLLDRGADVNSPTRYGRAAVAARGAVMRVLNHYAHYAGTVDRAVLDALTQLSAAVRAGRAPQRDDSRRFDMLATTVMNRMGERITRLEEDLWAAIRTRDGHANGGVANSGEASHPDATADEPTADVAVTGH